MLLRLGLYDFYDKLVQWVMSRMGNPQVSVSIPGVVNYFVIDLYYFSADMPLKIIINHLLIFYHDLTQECRLKSLISSV